MKTKKSKSASAGRISELKNAKEREKREPARLRDDAPGPMANPAHRAGDS